ncbi:MAG: hypothetical protein KZQ66_14365 [Candidatus Thiodiazotropha sp. (ex Lucinoma aequizonata)]|nr:hypothetical protein [Candidatus Thiodiazotropha sp. (ex Lucinoma aequizonata)]MCU7887163.1 hypothetical protein [Candidatus Thiodiazotropha sp. (ex Lucinoma aequizonata)]MCU7893714.1 hypothetical protein [Candidatus Thiodiazotropha sp. (ex Lucinoma aequizonata)]MCU7897288.1 hypothetical protein [Candidatus Thiodiazotropha sp. (ex Lucinoma aequizonata)]MCU7903032.1 hypothetical protein [Candidatus Thiodiazotropha sp. (ex Lucinoma aequizonata)]
MEPYEDNETPSPLRSYLDSIGDKMQVTLTLPEGMRIQLIYKNDYTVRLCSAWRQDYTLPGIVGKIPHENALSLLLSSTDISSLLETGLLTQLAFSRDMGEDVDTACTAGSGRCLWRCEWR